MIRMTRVDRNNVILRRHTTEWNWILQVIISQLYSPYFSLRLLMRLLCLTEIMIWHERNFVSNNETKWQWTYRCRLQKKSPEILVTKSNKIMQTSWIIIFNCFFFSSNDVSGGFCSAIYFNFHNIICRLILFDLFSFYETISMPSSSSVLIVQLNLIKIGFSILMNPNSI